MIARSWPGSTRSRFFHRIHSLKLQTNGSFQMSNGKKAPWLVRLYRVFSYTPGTLWWPLFLKGPTPPPKQGRISNRNKGHQRVPGISILTDPWVEKESRYPPLHVFRNKFLQRGKAFGKWPPSSVPHIYIYIYLQSRIYIYLYLEPFDDPLFWLEILPCFGGVGSLPK